MISEFFVLRNVICKITTSKTNMIAKELLTFSSFSESILFNSFISISFNSLEHFCAYKYSIFSTDLKEEYKNLSSANFSAFHQGTEKMIKKKKKKLTSQNTCILVTQINLSNIEYMFLFTVSSIIVFLQITIFNLNVIKIYACL